MSRWEDRSIKDDFNKASVGQKASPDQQEEPKLEFKPPNNSGPGMGGYRTSWDHHKHQKGLDEKAAQTKDTPIKDDPSLSKTFNNNAKNK